MPAEPILLNAVAKAIGSLIATYLASGFAGV
jgi:hypothetical protein